MITDGLQLLDSSVSVNLSIQSGDNLPNAGNNLGELFYKTGIEAGLYVFNNGWLKVSASQSIDASYDLAFAAAGLLGAGNVFIAALTRAFTLPANLPNSVATALSAATTTAVINLFRKPAQQAAIPIGNITFEAGSTVATLYFPDDVTFNFGDTFYANLASGDATLADVSVTLNGTLV